MLPSAAFTLLIDSLISVSTVAAAVRAKIEAVDPIVMIEPPSDMSCWVRVMKLVALALARKLMLLLSEPSRMLAPSKVALSTTSDTCRSKDWKSVL